MHWGGPGVVSWAWYWVRIWNRGLQVQEWVSRGVSPLPLKALGQEGGAPSRSSACERVIGSRVPVGILDLPKCGVPEDTSVYGVRLCRDSERPQRVLSLVGTRGASDYRGTDCINGSIDPVTTSKSPGDRIGGRLDQKSSSTQVG